MMKLRPGNPAPQFTAKDQDGKEISLAQFSGKKVVLYFYPQDDTPTCTEQACNLRDNIGKLRKRGIKVIGISPDTEKKHKKFQTKYSLPFTLIADPDQELVNLYGVWGEKQMFGRTYMGTHRVTFLINESGVIEHIIDKVTAKNHTAQILEAWADSAGTKS